jgi:putative transposase
VANTYSALYYHIVFSTKGREPWIAPDIEARVWGYLAEVANMYGMVALKIGGLEDHIHAVLEIPPTLPVSKAVQLLKGNSSRWIRLTLPELDTFRWQDGYGVFTVSKSTLPATIRYVERQREAHLKRTFQDEFRALLSRHDVAYDERYFWD